MAARAEWDPAKAGLSMGQYLPILALLVLAALFAGISFVGVATAQPAHPHRGQGGAL